MKTMTATPHEGAGIEIRGVDLRTADEATFGEKAVDVFYVTDLTGDKITAAPRAKRTKEIAERLKFALGKARAAGQEADADESGSDLPRSATRCLAARFA